MTRRFRPVGFVDSPVGFDDQVARLAGGLQFFSAYEVVEAGQRRLVPVSGMEAELRDGAEAEIVARLTGARSPLMLGQRALRLDQPQLMGILNLTPDSFSDGGRYPDEEAAVASGLAMIADGAAIVDVGGESTRPGALPVWEEDEIRRTAPVVAQLAANGAAVSIDTRKASVMEAALAAGALIVNDVSALCFDAQARALLATSDVPIVIMHSPDPARTLHDGGRYGDVVAEVYDWLEARIDALEQEGVARERLIVDPGIGFGKGLADNLALLNRLALFHGLGRPLLVGASRKRFIGALAGEAPVDQRLPGSLAIALKAAEQGAQLIRVHDVGETSQALKIWRGLRDAGLTG